MSIYTYGLGKCFKIMKRELIEAGIRKVGIGLIAAVDGLFFRSQIAFEFSRSYQTFNG
ncbi:hypothetical protein TCA2_4732 [Paenibacillus sp. TCA20]|nr:hypothetical protein TCA2_4732 [Paenibacillus sp. TCA20]